MRKFFTLVAFTAISFFASGQESAEVVIAQGGNNRPKFTFPQGQTAPFTLSTEDAVVATVQVDRANNRTSENLVLRDFDISIPENHVVTSIQVNILGKVENVLQNAVIVPQVNIGTYSNNIFAVASGSTQKTGTALQNSYNVSSTIWFSDEISGITRDVIMSESFAISFNLYNNPNTGSARALIDEVVVIITSVDRATLPVNFISFDAKSENNGTKLTWKVADQIDVLRYDVERSNDGNNFTKIGEVTAADVTTYSFTDNQPAQGTVYYRVKNVDVDGKFKYSTIVSLRNGASAIVLKAFPTPATNNVTLQHGSANAKTTIRINANDGRQVAALRPAAGTMQTNIDLSAYAPGLYLITFDNGNGRVETLKVVKQ